MHTADENTESWRPVVGYEGLYEVSDAGRVRSIDRISTYDGRLWKGRVLRLYTRPGAHQTVKLSRSGKVANQYVHRLVLAAFVGPCPPGNDACHGDGDPTNNRLTNLRWDTHRENMRDMVRHERQGNQHMGKTRCKRDHELAGANLYVQSDGGRGCRACRAAHADAHQRRVPMTREVADRFYANYMMKGNQ